MPRAPITADPQKIRYESRLSETGDGDRATSVAAGRRLTKGAWAHAEEVELFLCILSHHIRRDERSGTRALASRRKAEVTGMRVYVRESLRVRALCGSAWACLLVLLIPWAAVAPAVCKFLP